MPMSKLSLKELTPNTPPLMGWGNCDLIDPKLWRLIGMDVVHRGGHANDLIVHQRNCHVMPWVSKKLCRPARIDFVVEDPLHGPVEDRRI